VDTAQLQTAQKLVTDLGYYAANNLYITPKTGGLPIPFKFNRAQEYLHSRLEAQLRKTGKVRALVLKGRQQGISTYIGARFYHKTVTRKGTLTFIFAHDASASSSLFDMVQAYYDLSDQSFRPQLGSRNARELLFPSMRSGYKVGTAGSSGLGRGKTMQQVHWSEVAYSPDCEEHAAGLLQAVPDAPNTEVILESTAKGEGDYFHRACMTAAAGQSDYQLVFIPWYWQAEYTRAIEGDFAPEDDEQLYLDLFAENGLTNEHLNWRRFKIREFAGDVNRFKHEYPFTPEEAFEASDADSYIKAHLVRAARNTPSITSSAPFVMGVDPAAFGGDKFVVCVRKGRNLVAVKTYPQGYPHEQAQRLAQDIRQYTPQCVNIDAGGLGIGVIGCLRDLGYQHIVRKVDFGGKAVDADKYFNRTGELFGRARGWLEDVPVSFSCDEASAAAIQAELSGRKHTWHHNSQLRMEGKADFKKRLGYSPDKSDAFLLTFAELLPETAELARNRQQVLLAKTDWSPFA